MPLPNGLSTFSLSFGPYVDLMGNVSYAGMRGTLSVSPAIVDSTSGAQIFKSVSFVIGNDGTATVSPLVHNDDPRINQGTQYAVTWEALSYLPTPGNRTFVVPIASGSAVDYDLLTSTTGTATGTYALPLVTSVNGHAGAVTLSASDVGADAAGAASSVGTAVTTAAQSYTDGKIATEVTRADGKYVAAIGLDTAMTTVQGNASSAFAVALRAAFVPFWAPAETVTAGTVRMTADGHTIARIGNGTTRSTYDATEAALWAVVSGGSGASLIPTVTKTATYTAAVGDLAMMNVPGGAAVLNLPAAPADKAQVGYRAIGASAAVPLTVNRAGSDTIGTTGATSATVPLADETLIYQYDAPNTRWLAVSNVKTKASLDAMYGPGALADTATVYVAKSGSDSNDGRSWSTAKATIQAAINALPDLDTSANTNFAGIVEVGAGEWNVSSYGRIASVTMTSGTTTVPDTSASASDVGAWVIALNEPAAQIVSVIPGTSFTLGTAPASTLTVNALITNPAITLTPGVLLRGRGNVYSPRNSDIINGSANPAGTRIIDAGTGVTMLIPSRISGFGGSGTYGLRGISVTGVGSGFNGGANLFGLFVGDNAWFVDVQNCDFTSHGLAAVGLYLNINAVRFKDCLISGNGTTTSTRASGGILVAPGETNSCSLILDNCFFVENRGFGVVASTLAVGDVRPAYAVQLRSTQFNKTRATSTTGSGIGAVISGSDTHGISSVTGCWFETGENYDLQTTGQVIVQSSTFHSVRPYNVQVKSNGAYFIGCVFNSATTAAIDPGVFAFSWSNCFAPGTWLVQNAVPGAAAATPFGTYKLSPATFPIAATTVTLNSGTAWQNTLGYDVRLVVLASFAADADSVAIARGSTSTPTALGTITRKASTTDVLEFFVPANWYFKATLGGTATFTAAAIAQAA